MTPDELRRIEREWNTHPGMRHLGAQIDLGTPGVVRAIVDPLRPHHRGGMGTEAVNGAVIAGVLDVVVGLTGHLQMPTHRAGVAQLHIHYLRPVRGDRFTVIGRPTRVGRRLVFVSAELRDERDTVCALGDGIVAVAASSQASAPTF
jgi:uncharacterized protein (TIGR00369 family)